MAPDPKKAPDPSPGCPRCHYWEQTAEERAERRQFAPPDYPPIDQAKALVILTRAFPDSYRGRRG